MKAFIINCTANVLSIGLWGRLCHLDNEILPLFYRGLYCLTKTQHTLPIESIFILHAHALRQKKKKISTTDLNTFSRNINLEIIRIKATETEEIR